MRKLIESKLKEEVLKQLQQSKGKFEYNISVISKIKVSSDFRQLFDDSWKQIINKIKETYED